MNSLIETQMENIEKVYESLTFGERVEFSKSAIESIHQILRELKEYRQLEEGGKLIKLPCKVGDTLYLLDHECTEGMKYNCEIDGTMEGYLCRTCGTYPCTLHPSVQEVVAKNITIIKDNSMVVKLVDLRDVMIEDFGKTIFLTREDAENKLKEMKK